MPSDQRTYVRIHDGMPEHPKLVAVGGDAAWLHICGMAYCSRNMSDGMLPEAVVPRLSDRKRPAQLTEKLVNAGLWHRPGHGCERCAQPDPEHVVIHDYLEHQRSREYIEQIRTKRSAAGSRGGRPKANRNQIASGLDTEGLSHRESKRQSPRNPVSVSVSEVPTTSGASAPPDVHPGIIVAAWTDAMRANNVSPTNGMRGQVGRLARELLDSGNDPKRVLTAAEAAGRKGYATIDRELAALSGRPAAPVNGERSHITIEAWR